MFDAPRRSAGSPLADLCREEFAVWAGFLQTHAGLARELDADLRSAHGLPLIDFEILLWLGNRPYERMRMAALADTVLLSPSGLSRAVERLEARGLVQRIPCTEDRRGSYAALTESGADLVRRAGATHAAGIRRHFLDRLTPAETQLLAAVWDRLLAGDERCCSQPEMLAGGTDDARTTADAGKTRRTRRNNA
jgi:DNA-binding MarR family transcriptional regulator